MSEINSLPPPTRFEDFELDPRAGELRRAGVKVKLTGQPLLVLAALLERPGNVVTREELQKRLWPDTFVDVDHNLNTAINKIREALGDSAESPRFVETVPRRGYRFVGKLAVPEPALIAVEPVPQQIPQPQSHREWLRRALGIAVAAVIVISVVIAYRRPRRANLVEKEAPVSRPFTALPGIETNPDFSPDGSRIAFAWNGNTASDGKGFDLYVKAIGSETMLRLTQHPSQWLSPTWSPDGTQIAFHRMAGADTGIYVVPALGGPERKLRSTWIPTNFYLPLSWSPDGKWIAFSELKPGPLGKAATVSLLSLLSTETAESRQLPNPPQCNQAVSPHFSHSGELLAYLCAPAGAYFLQLYVESVLGGPPKLIATIGQIGRVSLLGWSRDDRALIYLNLGKFYEMNVSDGFVKRFQFAADADFSTLSPSSGALAYSQFSSSDLARAKRIP